MPERKNADSRAVRLSTDVYAKNAENRASQGGQPETTVAPNAEARMVTSGTNAALSAERKPPIGHPACVWCGQPCVSSVTGLTMAIKCADGANACCIDHKNKHDA